MLEFLSGVVCGAVLGVIVMALVNAGARADECACCMEKQRQMEELRRKRECAECRERQKWEQKKWGQTADNTKRTITFIPDKETGTIFGRFVPCRRDVDGVVGLWDTMENCFCETPGATSEESAIGVRNTPSWSEIFTKSLEIVRDSTTIIPADKEDAEE